MRLPQLRAGLLGLIRRMKWLASRAEFGADSASRLSIDHIGFDPECKNSQLLVTLLANVGDWRWLADRLIPSLDDLPAPS